MTSKKTIGLLAALCLALLAVSAAQGAGPGARYVFRGHLLATPPANDTSSVAGNGQRDQGEQGDAHTDQAGDRESGSSDNQGPTAHDSSNDSSDSDVSWQSGCSDGGHSNDYSSSNDCSDRSSRRD